MTISQRVVGSSPTARTRPFAMIPEAVLIDGQLSLGARVLYGVLMLYGWQSGQCWPTPTTIADRLGCSERQVSPSDPKEAASNA